MYIRKCPICENGKMKAAHMRRGWGKEYEYVCDSCGHSKWIYEGHPGTGESYENSSSGFWLMMIIVEVIVFMNHDNITILGYGLYLAVLLALLYKAFTPTPLKSPKTKEPAYEIIDSIDALTPEEKEEEERVKFVEKQGLRFWIYPIVFFGSIIAAVFFENYYLLILAVGSIVYAYYAGYLDISKNIKS
jgi:hypothetical protein